MGQIQEKRMVEANPEQMMNDQCKGEQGKRRALFYTWRRKQEDEANHVLRLAIRGTNFAYLNHSGFQASVVYAM